MEMQPVCPSKPPLRAVLLAPVFSATHARAFLLCPVGLYYFEFEFEFTSYVKVYY
jgi:hypothetical protein